MLLVVAFWIQFGVLCTGCLKSCTYLSPYISATWDGYQNWCPIIRVHSHFQLYSGATMPLPLSFVHTQHLIPHLYWSPIFDTVHINLYQKFSCLYWSTIYRSTLNNGENPSYSLRQHPLSLTNTKALGIGVVSMSLSTSSIYCTAPEWCAILTYTQHVKLNSVSRITREQATNDVHWLGRF